MKLTLKKLVFRRFISGNKIATLVGLSASVEGAEVVAKDVAMQAVAMNPIALNEEGVDASVIEKEIEIAKDQLRQEGPEAVLENIAKGKLHFFKDNTLGTKLIKDGKQSVAEYVKSIGDVSVVLLKSCFRIINQHIIKTSQ